jgi:hypothetical protein
LNTQTIPGGSNPAMVVYPNATTGNPVYSLWVSGKIQVANSPDGPFTELPNSNYGGIVGGNPAPLYHDGAFYSTSQGTSTVWTTPSLSQPWTVHATISVPWTTRGTREDPFMWIDKRGNWHIINHVILPRTSPRKNVPIVCMC